MIVVGLDVHKQSVTAVAVDEAGRPLAEKVIRVGSEELLEWAAALDRKRLWAVEDCRQLTPWLERQLLSVGEELVRVPPKLTVPERPAGRRAESRTRSTRSRSLVLPCGSRIWLDSPRPNEARLRELKLLVDHRDDLVDERRRAQQRLRWHLHELDPSVRIPLGALDRSVWLERLARRLSRREQTTQVRIARELLGRCRSLSRSIAELDHELHQQAATLAPRLLELPGCAALTASKLLCEIGPIHRFRSDAQLARHAGVAPLDASSGKHRRHRLDRGGNRQLNCALHRIAVTQGRVHPPARAYLERKQAEGKSRREPLRCLKRQLARTIHTTPENQALLT